MRLIRTNYNENRASSSPAEHVEIPLLSKPRESDPLTTVKFSIPSASSQLSTTTNAKSSLLPAC
jgi:hypothetical protein